ncbi:MAG: Mrp/NBP35 family ATP-binding protein [Acidimicrobiia bacterium]|nr:Mrp/NBP35 family ATP-binding protein [Acidimicrobiia bacterium]MDX2467966.1 Mrp/NBP35 family ATP-binding protein [Acidimicrobiia bacterium]
MIEMTEIEAALKRVIDPELGADIVDLGMVKDVRVEGNKVTVKVALTIAACPLRDQIENEVLRKLRAVPGVEEVAVEIGAMTQAERTDLMERARLRAREDAEPTMVHPNTRVVAISSGKGGVGKSSLSANLALAISAQGHKVGLLDADIWGFSIPRILGLGGKRLEAGDDRRIIPAKAYDIDVVSTGLLLDDEDTALMWRGLMLSKALEQFLRDVAWPQDLDYLLLDMPPGTGDVQMALARLLPQAEMVVVTTPQLAAQKVAARVADMARRSHMPVIGVIENMAGFTTPSGEHFPLFGTGGGQALADDLGVDLLGAVPIDPRVAEGGDAGNPVVAADPGAPSAIAITNAAKELTSLLPPIADDGCSARLTLVAEQIAQMG